MNLFESIGIDMGYVLIGTIVVIIVLTIMLIIMLIQQRKMIKKYNNFMQGATGESIETVLNERFSEIALLKEESRVCKEDITNIKEELLNTFQKIGIVKYDAFKEMGGKLSFVLVLLTDKNNGYLVNSVHSSREGCYTYIKEIINGEAFVLLSEEEKQALDIAINSKNITR